MENESRFLIHNDLGRPVTLNIEPEGAWFSLGHGDDVSVTDRYTKSPVTVKLTTSKDISGVRIRGVGFSDLDF